MGWYANQKARNDAKKAGEPRPETGGLGDKVSAKFDSAIELTSAKADAAGVRKVEAQAAHAAKKAERS